MPFEVYLHHAEEMSELDGIDMRHVCVESFRGPHKRIFLRQTVVGLSKPPVAQQSCQRLRLLGDMTADTRQDLRLRPIDSPADEKCAPVIDMKVVSRLQSALGAVANRRAEVRLVWRPVLGKPRVAVDAEHRFFRIDHPERAIELRYSGGDVADQRLEFVA